MILKPHSRDFFSIPKLSSKTPLKVFVHPAGKEIQFLWCQHFFVDVRTGHLHRSRWWWWWFCDDYNVGYFRPSAGQRQPSSQESRPGRDGRDLPPHLRQYLVRFIVTSGRGISKLKSCNLALCLLKHQISIIYSSQIDSQPVIKRLPLSSGDIRQKMFWTVWWFTSVRISSQRCIWPLYVLWNNDVNHPVAHLSHSIRM